VQNPLNTAERDRKFVDAAPQSDIPVRKPHETTLQNVVYCGIPSTVQAMHPWRAALHSTLRRRRRLTGRQGRFRSLMKCVPILAEFDALIDSAPFQWWAG
jgi:hypothetical protein